MTLRWGYGYSTSNATVRYTYSNTDISNIGCNSIRELYSAFTDHADIRINYDYSPGMPSTDNNEEDNTMVRIYKTHYNINPKGTRGVPFTESHKQFQGGYIAASPISDTKYRESYPVPGRMWHVKWIDYLPRVDKPYIMNGSILTSYIGVSPRVHIKPFHMVYPDFPSGKVYNQLIYELKRGYSYINMNETKAEIIIENIWDSYNELREMQERCTYPNNFLTMYYPANESYIYVKEEAPRLSMVTASLYVQECDISSNNRNVHQSDYIIHTLPVSFLDYSPMDMRLLKLHHGIEFNMTTIKIPNDPGINKMEYWKDKYLLSDNIKLSIGSKVELIGGEINGVRGIFTEIGNFIPESAELYEIIDTNDIEIAS